MIAVVGGLSAAFLWASSTLTSSRAGRLIGPMSTLAWMMLVGVVIALPLSIVSGPLPDVTPTLGVWALVSGLGGLIGMVLIYKALRIGKVGVVSAVASTEGAIAAVISVIGGEQLTIPVAAVLVALVVGVAIVALSADDSVPAAATAEPDPAKRQALQRLSIIYAVGAALVFGLSIYGTAQLGKSVNPFAAVLPVRLAGVLLVFVPMAAGRRLKLVRPVVPMVILIGSAEVFGNAAYAWGATQSVAISAVLASQFAGVAAIAAFLIFHEKLTVGQRSGVVAIAAGVAVLTLVR